ncbi:hypothetical protein EDB85DRAFT_1048056 [Lactarius pseudohatsudake]|nr:hypothetical protein EDB85DRAFT_1048056 [Lactarius pseudohatsudake]
MAEILRVFAQYASLLGYLGLPFNLVLVCLTTASENSFGWAPHGQISPPESKLSISIEGHRRTQESNKHVSFVRRTAVYPPSKVRQQLNPSSCDLQLRFGLRFPRSKSSFDI